MNGAHLHLLLNHIPILGSLFGFCLLAYGLLRKNHAVRKAGLVTLFFVALVAIPAYLSGEEAEDTVEDIHGVSIDAITEHEELAEVAIWFMSATGLLALLALGLPGIMKKKMRHLAPLTLLLAAVTVVIMVAVGERGGKIRHSEVRGSHFFELPAGDDD